jgi:hypothetical protein
MMRELQASQRQSAPAGFWLLIGLLALFAASKVVLYDTLDPDCFWHLRVADQLCRNGIGPIVDDLSFASGRQPWTPYSWLAELGMRALWNLGGYRAAVAVTAATSAGIVLLLVLCCLQMRGGYVTTVLAVALGEFLILPYLSFRPVTFAFVPLFTIAWLALRDRHRRSTALWLAVPLTALMTNLHLFSFFVPGMMAAMAMGAAVERNPPAARRYNFLTAATALACLATPMLPGLLRTLLFYSTRDAMVAGPVISEMQSFVHGKLGWINAVGLAMLLLCIARQYRRVAMAQLICIAITTLLMLKIGRFAPLFALAACPALAATMPQLKDRLLGRPALVGTMVLIVCAGTARLIAAFPAASVPISAWVNRHGPDTPGYPCAAADFVAQKVNRTSCQLINEFSWGGYLAWRLDGQYKILLDGRTQVYPPSLWQATYLGTEQDRERFLSHIQADAALIPAGKSAFRPALMQLGWTSVYTDDRAEVLLPPASFARSEQ